MSDNEGYMLAVEKMREVAREELTPILKDVLQDALNDIPNRNEVERMVKDAAERQADGYYASFKSVDTHLRESEVAFTKGLKEIQSVVGKLEGTAELWRASGNQIQALQDHYNILDGRVSTAISAAHELRRDIFGDPLSPDIPSLLSEQRRRDRALDEQRTAYHTETTNRLESLKAQAALAQIQVDERLRPVEGYIRRREQIEGWIYSGLGFFARHPNILKAVVGFVLARFGVQIGTEFVVWLESVK